MSTKNRAVVWIGGAAAKVSLRPAIFYVKPRPYGSVVFAYNSYQSVIRGGHVIMKFRLAAGIKFFPRRRARFLVALNQDTVKRHAEKVLSGGASYLIRIRSKWKASKTRPGVQLIGIPVEELTKEFGRNPVMQNTLIRRLIHLLVWIGHL